MLWIGALAVGLAAVCHAQNADSLKRYFEGKHVTVKMDMPGTHHGVDVHLERDGRVDMSSYSSRLKQFGVSIREGDRVMITLIKVNKKNIEFQLAGGGFGAMGDMSGLPSVPSTTVSKSDRERRLEKDLGPAPEAEKRRIREDLDRERRNRQSDERVLRARSESIRADRQRLEFEKRRTGGSRFNIWFPEGRLLEAVPSPEAIMTALAEQADFSEVGRRPAAKSLASRQELPQPSGGQIRRGMSEREVHAALGRPVSRKEARQGDLATVTERFDSGDSVTDVTYVGGVVVKFATASK